MKTTIYNKEAYVIRDNSGNYLKEDSTDPDAPVFVDNPESVRYWNNSTQAQDYAAAINERYIAGRVPKRVLVYKMTVSTVIEPMPVPKRTKRNI